MTQDWKPRVVRAGDRLNSWLLGIMAVAVTTAAGWGVISIKDSAAEALKISNSVQFVTAQRISAVELRTAVLENQNADVNRQLSEIKQALDDLNKNVIRLIRDRGHDSNVNH
jgi:hypothetical protein